VHLPTLVRGGRKSAREQVFFVFAQAGRVPDFSKHPGDFFFHDAILPEIRPLVEGEFRRGIPAGLQAGQD